LVSESSHLGGFLGQHVDDGLLDALREAERGLRGVMGEVRGRILLLVRGLGVRSWGLRELDLGLAENGRENGFRMVNYTGCVALIQEL
jgi:hypothetical protein